MLVLPCPYGNSAVLLSIDTGAGSWHLAKKGEEVSSFMRNSPNESGAERCVWHNSAVLNYGKATRVRFQEGFHPRNRLC
jgi:hypothetical protein